MTQLQRLADTLHDLACLDATFGNRCRCVRHDGDADHTMAAAALSALPDLARMEAGLTALRSRHERNQASTGQTWCLYCGADWPCPTVQTVDQALATQKD